MGAARTAIVSGKMHYSVNGISVDWDDRPLRSSKKCVVCHMPTSGRIKDGDGKTIPAHMACAMMYVDNQVTGEKS